MKIPLICIIDDDTNYQYSFTREIKSFLVTKKILVFSDGEEAIHFFESNVFHKNELPDVVFLDINMPIMDGWEFLESFAKLKPSLGKRITIYMISSSIDESDIHRAKQIEDISDYIIKPIDPNKLKKIIESIEDRELTDSSKEIN